MKERAGGYDWRVRLENSKKTGVGFAAPGGFFARAAYGEIRKRPELRRLLLGESVIELGAGETPYGYLLACALGAANYLAVEPFYSDALEASLKRLQHRMAPERLIPYAVLTTDMLSALRLTADRSSSLLAFGLEECVLPGDGYIRRVEGEIQRALSETGVFITYRSDLHPAGLRVQEIPFRRIDSGRGGVIRLHTKNR